MNRYSETELYRGRLGAVKLNYIEDD